MIKKGFDDVDGQGKGNGKRQSARSLRLNDVSWEVRKGCRKRAYKVRAERLYVTQQPPGEERE